MIEQSVRPIIDALEARCLFAVSVGVNFQPAGTPAYGDYLVDTGSTFADRGNGFSYGWSSANANARDRNSTRSADQRFDTFNHMQVSGNRSWEIAVPNGTYQVNLAAGDADFFNSVYKINVEGVLAIDGTPTTNSRWIQGSATVTVTDGRLTITNASGSNNNKINYIEFAPVGAPPTTVAVTATDASASETGPNSGQFTITRTGDTNQPLEVYYTVSGSASNGTDYASIPASTIIPAGQSSVNINVNPVDDSGVEGNETVVLTLTGTASYNVGGASSATVTIADNDTAAPPPPTSQAGLTGEYFDNQDLTGPMLTRVDSTVNFNWGTAAPHSSMSADTFSVRWTGFVQPQYSENYRFYVDANNGVRLWVNGQLIIDRWTNAYGETSGTINLQAGQKYAIKLEYFDFDNNANAKLSWSSASRSKQVIPSSALSTSTNEEPPPPPPTNNAPTVSLTSPGSGTNFAAGSTITIVAGASDTDGAVTKVEFFANGTKIGEDLGGDFDTDWFNVSAGTYIITAIATDDDGATTTSQSITLTVTGGSTPTSTVINWAPKANSPITRFEAPSVVIDGKVWVFGGWYWDNGAQVLRGSRRVDVYNPDTNTWAQRANLPTELTHQGVVVDGNFIYMIGGFVGQDPGVATNDIWRYSISANTWTKMTWELPDYLAAGGAVLIGRQLHWIGGSEEDRVSDTGSHWVMNIDNPNAGWTELAPMPNPRHHFSTAVVDGKIYIFGGQHGHDTEARTQDNTAHVYNPATNTWTALKNLPRAMSHAEPGTFVMNGKIYIGGGLDANRVPLNTLTEYDPVTNTYREMTPLPNSVTAPVVQYVGNNRIFFTAGTAAVGGAQSQSWLGTLA